MIIKQARKLLGKKAENLSDEEVRAVMRTIRIYAEACYKRIYEDGSTLANELK